MILESLSVISVNNFHNAALRMTSKHLIAIIRHREKYIYLTDMNDKISEWQEQGKMDLKA